MASERKTVAAVILAAGQGTRMKSEMPKVLHDLLGKPMILYVLETAAQAGLEPLVVVVGAYSEQVRKAVSIHYDVRFAFQKDQLGTGHAAKIALPHVPGSVDQVIIMCGDVPLLRPETLTAMIDDHVQTNRDLTVLGVDLKDSSGYGRLVFDDHRNLVKIVEEADATAAERQIKTINAGTYCVKKPFLSDALHRIKRENMQGEFYLTDVIEIGHRASRQMAAFIGADPREVRGVNTKADLEAVESQLRRSPSKTS